MNIDAPRPGELGPYLKALPAYQRARSDLLAKYRVPELQRPWELKLIEAAANPVSGPIGITRSTSYAPAMGRRSITRAIRCFALPPEQRSERQKKSLTDHFIDNYYRVITQRRTGAS